MGLQLFTRSGQIDSAKGTGGLAFSSWCVPAQWPPSIFPPRTKTSKRIATSRSRHGEKVDTMSSRWRTTSPQINALLRCLRDVEKADRSVRLFVFRYGSVPIADQGNSNE